MFCAFLGFHCNKRSSRYNKKMARVSEPGVRTFTVLGMGLVQLKILALKLVCQSQYLMNQISPNIPFYPWLFDNGNHVDIL
jgi:hypothetical protein